MKPCFRLAYAVSTNLFWGKRYARGVKAATTSKPESRREHRDCRRLVMRVAEAEKCNDMIQLLESAEVASERIAAELFLGALCRIRLTRGFAENCLAGFARAKLDLVQVIENEWLFLIT